MYPLGYSSKKKCWISGFKICGEDGRINERRLEIYSRRQDVDVDCLADVRLIERLGYTRLKPFRVVQSYHAVLGL